MSATIGYTHVLGGGHMKWTPRSIALAGTNVPRAAAVAAAFTLAVTLLGACDTPSDPSNATSEPTSASTRSAPTPTWRSDFSATEVAAYDEGLAWFEAYDLEEEAILREGKATPEAKQLYQENRTDWRAAWRDLQLYEKQKIVFPRRPEVLSTEPAVIRIGDDKEASLRINRCVDSRVVKATMNGEPLEVANDFPTKQTVALNRYGDGSWRVLTVKTSGERCGG
jgi:hypothetical protein